MSKIIKEAIKDRNAVHSAWGAAFSALSGSASNNGYGIYHYQGDEVRRLLVEAQKQIQIALNTLNKIEWPSDQDYDDYD